MDSRKKFEEWFNKRYFVSNEQGSHIKEMSYVAWKAGRESMREEEKEEKKTFLWECNECGSQEYTMCVSEDDVQNLGCGSCGASEWHKAEKKP